MHFKVLAALFLMVVAICAFAPSRVAGQSGITYHFEECNGAPNCAVCCQNNGHVEDVESREFSHGCVCVSHIVE